MTIDYENMTIDCEKCGNKGYYIKRDEKDLLKVEVINCECMPMRRYLKKLKDLNLGDNAIKNTFENYIASEDWQRDIVKKARDFLNGGKMFYIGGQIGSGKTMICNAIVNELLKKDKNCFYTVWDDISTRLKQTTYGSETKYYNYLNELTNTEILFIDDFFKKQPTEEDKSKAFQVINARYTHTNGRTTIISGEKTFNELLAIDEATASRIYEMAGKGNFIVSIDKDINKNFRLK